MRATPAILLLLAWLTGACAPEVPAEPTWIDDVRPIMAANCIRCHSPPSIGAAPTYFRLDIYENDLFVDPEFEDVVYGAERMSRGYDEANPPPVLPEQGDLEIVALAGTMPPRLGLTDRQVDVLVAWRDAEQPKGEPRAGNAAPSLTVIDGVQVISPGRVGFLYEIEDADDDIVTGVIISNRVGGDPDMTVETNQIIVGRGSVRFSLDPGTYELMAELDDGHERVTVDLGMVVVP